MYFFFLMIVECRESLIYILQVHEKNVKDQLFDCSVTENQSLN